MKTAKCPAKQADDQALQWELADIFREYGQDYRNTHHLPLLQLKVMHAIEICRTSHLGGHLQKCDLCGYEHPVYNSCGNRHCPKCQVLAKVRWLEARQAELLPVPYFHNVFTMPHELNPLSRCNKKVMYDILFKSSSQTILTFGKNPENGIGGQMGFTAVLHTWEQKLLEHIHIHCIIPSGALSFDKKRWIHARNPDFLFPVKALSKVFRGKFINNLEKALASGKLIFPGQCADLATEEGFRILIDKLWQTDWVVFSKKPFAGPEQVLEYLGRYTHRVAISNNRIKKVENNHVTFTYRDRRDDNKIKELTLPVEKFIQRFLLHVLPTSYMRIRHFGFFSNRWRKKNVVLCKNLLGLHEESVEIIEQSTQEIMLRLTGKDVNKCPRCKKGKLVTYRVIPRPSATRIISDFLEPEVIDTS